MSVKQNLYKLQSHIPYCEFDKVFGNGYIAYCQKRKGVRYMMREIGQRIAKIREARGMKQRDVERRANLAAGSMSRLESGARAITMGQAQALARALRVDITQLYYDGEIEDEGLCAALVEVRKHCSLRQRRAIAGMLVNLAEELAPAGMADDE